MSSLANQQQNLSFPGLLQVPGGITSTLQTVQDGNGNPTGLQISSSGVNAATSTSSTVSNNGTQFTGATARLISDMFGDIINVRDFGAIGNGIADDTVAIKAAAAAASGKTLYFPGGNYLISQGVYIQTNCVWKGDGKGITKITASAAFTNPVTTSWPDYCVITSVSGATNIGLIGISFIGAGESTVHTYNIVIRGATGVLVSNCEATLWGKRTSPSLYVQGFGVASTNVVIENSSFTQCSGDGLVGAGDDSNNVIITGCTAGDNDDWGIVATNCPGHIRIIGNYLYNNKNVGTGSDECIDVVIANNVIVGQNLTAQYGIRNARFGPTPGYSHLRVLVANNIIQDCPTAISLESFTESTIISGNIIKNGSIGVTDTVNSSITGNTISNTSGNYSGIGFISYTLPCGNNTVTGNTVTGADYAFRELNISGTVTKSNFIGNTASSSTVSNYSLIAGNTYQGLANGNLAELDYYINGGSSPVCIGDGAFTIGTTIGNAISTYGYTAAITPASQITGATITKSALGLNLFNSTAGLTPNLIFSRSLSNTVGTQTAVSNLAVLGALTFTGSDGASFIRGASISAVVSGTVATGYMPTQLQFSVTPASSGTPVNALLIDPTGVVKPATDNTQTLGAASFRWSVVYAGTGTINTSDERQKTDINDLTATEKAVAQVVKGLIKSFKYTDAVTLKGDNARTHFGVMAQEVGAAFIAAGLDPDKYGLFCYDKWDAVDEVKDDEGNILQHAIAAGDQYGIRYEELLAFIISTL